MGAAFAISAVVSLAVWAAAYGMQLFLPVFAGLGLPGQLLGSVVIGALIGRIAARNAAKGNNLTVRSVVFLCTWAAGIVVSCLVPLLTDDGGAACATNQGILVGCQFMPATDFLGTLLVSFLSALVPAAFAFYMAYQGAADYE